MKQLTDNDSNNASAGAFFTGLFAGAVIGAGIGLWFAPKSGTEFRDDVTGTARDLGKRVSKTVDDMTDRGREMFDRARDAVSAAGDQIDKATTDAAKTLERGRRGVQNVAAAAERS